MISYIQCKNGTKIEQSIYEEIYNEIIVLMENCREVPPPLFFSILHEQFANTVGKNVGWYLFQIKVDMEMKGLLKTRRARKKRNGLAVIVIAGKSRLRNKLKMVHLYPDAC